MKQKNKKQILKEKKQILEEVKEVEIKEDIEEVLVEDVPVARLGWVDPVVWESLTEDQRKRLCKGDSLEAVR